MSSGGFHKVSSGFHKVSSLILVESHMERLSVADWIAG